MFRILKKIQNLNFCWFFKFSYLGISTAGMYKVVSALYLPQLFSDPFHIHTHYQATSEGVPRVEIFKKFPNLNFCWIFYSCLVEDLYACEKFIWGELWNVTVTDYLVVRLIYLYLFYYASVWDYILLPKLLINHSYNVSSYIADVLSIMVFSPLMVDSLLHQWMWLAATLCNNVDPILA